MASSNASRSALTGILAGGLVAGTVDLGAAALISLVSPIVIARYVAVGVLGMRSLELGSMSAVLGLLLQWAMSILIAAIYALGARSVPAVRRRWVAAGLAAGVVIFFVMNYVVLPLSAVGHRAHFTPKTFVENLLAMLLFGVIIAYFARDTARRSP
jgi:uncharacterized membrane protein YagU involved in acid resistance